MATSFEEIYDLALITIQDYKLDYAYQNHQDIFYKRLKGLLIRSIPKFTGCLTSLEYDATSDSFIEELSSKEKNILADLTTITWWDGVINDIRQVNLHISKNEFKVSTEASNLKEKSERVDRLREKVRQDITEYQLEADIISY